MSTAYRTYHPLDCLYGGAALSAAEPSSVGPRYNLKTIDTSVPSCFWYRAVPLEPTNGKVRPGASEVDSDEEADQAASLIASRAAEVTHSPQLRSVPQLLPSPAFPLLDPRRTSFYSCKSGRECDPLRS